MVPSGKEWAPDLSLSIEDRVTSIIDTITKSPKHVGPDAVALKGVKLLRAGPNVVEYELEIRPEHINMGGNLHGGAAATILDNLTSGCLVTVAKPGYLDGPNVSRTITMSYLRPVPLGTKATIYCELVSGGRNTANIRGEIRNEAGKVCVTCIHDKVVFPTKPKL